MRLLLTTAMLGMLTTPVAAQTFHGIASVRDGDSLSVAGIGIRLFGIDAPELSQTCKRDGKTWACGEESKRQLETRVQGQQVECRGRGIDDYGRTLAQCIVAGVDLNREFVEAGWAIAFRQYSAEYVLAEEGARAASLGIWSSTFEEPAAWRTANPQRPQSMVSRQSKSRTSYRDPTYASAGCNIKGNHSRRGEWIYHLPGMPYYNETRPEAMFCSEAEAQAAGYRRARVRR